MEFNLGPLWKILSVDQDGFHTFDSKNSAQFMIKHQNQNQNFHSRKSSQQSYNMFSNTNQNSLFSHQNQNQNHAYEQIINKMGEMSCKAQQLKQQITTFDKLMSAASNQRVYMMISEKKVIGFIKVGSKNLFYRNNRGEVKELQNLLCVLDFYCHESVQRQGYGKNEQNSLFGGLNNTYDIKNINKLQQREDLKQPTMQKSQSNQNFQKNQQENIIQDKYVEEIGDEQRGRSQQAQSQQRTGGIKKPGARSMSKKQVTWKLDEKQIVNDESFVMRVEKNAQELEKAQNNDQNFHNQYFGANSPYKSQDHDEYNMQNEEVNQKLDEQIKEKQKQSSSYSSQKPPTSNINSNNKQQLQKENSSQNVKAKPVGYLSTQQIAMQQAVEFQKQIEEKQRLLKEKQQQMMNNQQKKQFQIKTSVAKPNFHHRNKLNGDSPKQQHKQQFDQRKPVVNFHNKKPSTGDSPLRKPPLLPSLNSQNKQYSNVNNKSFNQQQQQQNIQLNGKQVQKAYSSQGQRRGSFNENENKQNINQHQNQNKFGFNGTFDSKKMQDGLMVSSTPLNKVSGSVQKDFQNNNNNLGKLPPRQGINNMSFKNQQQIQELNQYNIMNRQNGGNLNSGQKHQNNINQNLQGSQNKDISNNKQNNSNGKNVVTQPFQSHSLEPKNAVRGINPHQQQFNGSFKAPWAQDFSKQVTQQFGTFKIGYGYNKKI
ncbi:hypothetical protein PPERSA_04042 [Pseudocohnilembus persalinus]|uniref:N-acetyltransferase domain-containing protein n=1 Tax=Pseudocohnilembus persalinus TaxID=266149 RepID=A0A0V0QL23_PSEPJ|nr:hypothetical protein PPERSA_04042 [Pseudocohnilembus persalinus]|eukprot:KRX02839.1 hypothetical protein PPERSA_04042 [Pseudocohnilembus persalinus]